MILNLFSQDDDQETEKREEGQKTGAHSKGEQNSINHAAESAQLQGEIIEGTPLPLLSKGERNLSFVINDKGGDC